MSSTQTHKFSKQADLNNTDFCNVFRPFFSKIAFASYFRPEAFENSEEAVVGFKILLEYLKIKHLKIPLSWKKIENEQGEINLDYYLPYFELVKKYDVDVCLEIGPIKNIDGSSSIPNYILESLKKADLLPKRGSVIKLDSTLATRSLDYAENLCSCLREKIDPEVLAKISSFQLEYAPFSQKDSSDFTLSVDYMQELAHLASEYFPNKKLVLTLNKLENLGAVIQVVEVLPYDLVIGVNYSSPFIPKKFSFGAFMKGIKQVFSAENPDDLKKLASKYILEIAVSDFGIEHLMGDVAAEENLRQFKLMILEAKDYLDLGKTSFITLSGTEKLVIKLLEQKENSVDKEILDLIQRIQIASPLYYLK